MSAREIGWAPDGIFTGERIETGLAFFASELGRITRFSREPADLAAAKPLKGQVVFPGLVNAHADPVLRVVRGRTEPRTAGEREAPGRRHAALTRARAALRADGLYDAARMAFMELLLSGTTTAVVWLPAADTGGGTPEDSYREAAAAILRAARETGLRVALYPVAGAGSDTTDGGGGGASAFSLDEFVRAVDALRERVAREFPGDDIWLGLGVGGLDAVTPEQMKALAAYAHAQRFRMQVPVAGTAREVEACRRAHGCTPVAWAAELGLLDKRFVAVHAAELTGDDVRALGAARAAVCACPAGELALGRNSAPADELLAAGVTVAVGTGAGTHMNVLEDARLLEWRLRRRRGERAVLPSDLGATLLHAATTAGARALGAPSGVLEVGRPADFFTVHVYDPSLAGAGPATLLHQVVFGLERRAIREVWVGARQRVVHGRHLQQGPIVGRFVELQRSLWGDDQ